VFSVEQRDEVRQGVVELAEEDGRVVAAAEVGSLAAGGGDRWSDLDLTFGIAGAELDAVLRDWTRKLGHEYDAIPLVDLVREPTIYRVFLLPDELQIDLSVTPADAFRPAGPRFKLLFGETPDDEPPVSPPRAASDLFGWGVIYGIHARRCIERDRPWQAEHYINATRDHALMLACLHNNLPVVQARGYDDLPDDILKGLADTHVQSLDPAALRAAFAASMRALLREADDLPEAAAVVSRLDALG
jgi:predicted nucleotidyltransferase